MYKVICYLCIIARYDNTDVLLGLACSKGTVSRDQQPLFTIFAICVTLDRSLEYIVWTLSCHFQLWERNINNTNLKFIKK